MLAKQRGEDGPLTVKFYSDPQNRSIRLKHQRSSTFPLPAVLSKLPPSSLTSFSKHSMNDAHLVGEGLKTFLLVLPDGSGYCKYPEKGPRWLIHNLLLSAKMKKALF